MSNPRIAALRYARLARGQTSGELSLKFAEERDRVRMTEGGVRQDVRREKLPFIRKPRKSYFKEA